MKYHDYFLAGYEVQEGGELILLHLKRQISGGSAEYSDIAFSSVALYHIVHTDNAIVTRLDQVPVRDLLAQNRDFIESAGRKIGVRRMSGNFIEYVSELELNGYCGWQLESAIGLSGFVIAKRAEQVCA